jgi:hypothetical protein
LNVAGDLMNKTVVRSLAFGVVVAFFLLGFGFSSARPNYCSKQGFCGPTAGQIVLVMSIAIGYTINHFSTQRRRKIQ